MNIFKKLVIKTNLLVKSETLDDNQRPFLSSPDRKVMQNPSPTFVTKGEENAKKSENYTFNYNQLPMEGGTFIT